jgi:uncharacterized protein YqgV (UPF0045/DUF77 family)
MAQSQNETLACIQQYVTAARKLQDDPMDLDASATETRLEQTVKELQERVQEQQAALDRVRDILYHNDIMIDSVQAARIFEVGY